VGSGKAGHRRQLKFSSVVLIEMANKRTTKRKLSPGLKAWNEKVMKHFKNGRKTRGKSYTLKMAMSDAKKAK
jgi:hypothetical protein